MPPMFYRNMVIFSTNLIQDAIIGWQYVVVKLEPIAVVLELIFEWYMIFSGSI